MANLSSHIDYDTLEVLLVDLIDCVHEIVNVLRLKREFLQKLREHGIVTDNENLDIRIEEVSVYNSNDCYTVSFKLVLYNTKLGIRSNSLAYSCSIVFGKDCRIKSITKHFGSDV